MGRRESRLSPPPSTSSLVGGVDSMSYQEPGPPQLEVVSEELRGSDNVFGVNSMVERISSSEGVCLGQDRSPEFIPPPPPPLGNIDVELGISSTADKLSNRKEIDALCPAPRHHTSHSSPGFLQRQMSTDELKRVSPYYMLEEEGLACEFWVASSNAQHSTISVIDYGQRFTNFEVHIE